MLSTEHLGRIPELAYPNVVTQQDLAIVRRLQAEGKGLDGAVASAIISEARLLLSAPEVGDEAKNDNPAQAMHVEIKKSCLALEFARPAIAVLEAVQCIRGGPVMIREIADTFRPAWFNGMVGMVTQLPSVEGQLAVAAVRHEFERQRCATLLRTDGPLVMVRSFVEGRIGRLNEEGTRMRRHMRGAELQALELGSERFGQLYRAAS